MNTCPIGIYDSGVGGLSVLREIYKLLPHEDLLYFGDQAKCPYGPRPSAELQALGEGVTEFLISKEIKLLVIACNTASAASLHYLREKYPQLPIVGMEPAVKPAAENTHSKKVGVLATPSTFAGSLYTSTVERFAHDTRIFESTCPGLVAQIEKGRLNTPKTRAILSEALKPMIDAGVDTLVMGCTHYPFVIPTINKLTKAVALVIDPAPAVARQVERVLKQHEIENNAEHSGAAQFYTSGNSATFKTAIKKLIGLDAETVPLKWESGRLTCLK